MSDSILGQSYMEANQIVTIDCQDMYANDTSTLLNEYIRKYYLTNNTAVVSLFFQSLQTVAYKTKNNNNNGKPTNRTNGDISINISIQPDHILADLSNVVITSIIDDNNCHIHTFESEVTNLTNLKNYGVNLYDNNVLQITRLIK